LCCGLAAAWDAETHQAIWELAKTVVPERNHEKVAALVSDGTPVRFHEVESRYKWATHLHEHFQPDWQCKFDRSKGCDSDGHCLADGLEQSYRRLAREPGTIAPQGLLQPSLAELSQTDLGVLVVELLAELHEPLRFAFESQIMGTELIVSIDTPEGGSKRDLPLYDLFEVELPARLKAEADKSGKSFAAYLKETMPPTLYRDEKHRFRLEHEDKFLQWADESTKSVCNDIFHSMLTTSESRDVPKRFDVPAGLLSNWQELVKRQLVHAAVRVGAVLEEVVRIQSGVSTHQGAKTEPPVIHRGRHHVREDWVSQLLTNLGIAAVAVPSLIGFVKWHEDRNKPGKFV